MISVQKFIELTGEDPEDVLGGDWQNIIADYEEEDFFCPANNCGNPISLGENCGDKH